MPTFQTNVAARIGKLGKAGNVDQTLYQGDLKILRATVTVPSTLAANDIIEIGVIPAGARVLPSLSQVVCHADPGSSLRLQIGDAADTDRYAAILNLDSGGVVNFTAPSIPDGVANNLKVAVDTPIFATVTTATSITNNSVLTFQVAFVV